MSSAAGILEFDIFHDTENTFDGVVVEIKIGSGAYQDLLAAGGSFTQNGYNATLGNWSGCVANPNPLANRQAFTGGPATKAVRATLPAAANGQNVRIRFRMGSDCSVGDVGARIDNVKVTAGVTCNGPCGSTRTVRSDYDGDGKTDFAIWRPSEGNFWLLRSTAGAGAIQWGQNGDTPIAADLTGDRMSDIIAFRPGATTSDFSMFYTLGTPGYGYSGYPWGTQGDIPVMGDFNGDGKSDSAVYRPSESTFYLLLSDDPNPVRVLPFGTAGDIPFAGDFIGDGRSDLALYRPSNGTWYIAEAQGDPNTESIATPWGLSTDKPVAADYDGDNKDDIAVYRPSTGVWYILESQTQQIRIVQWGGPTDVPVPGDYDGDSKYDIAIFNNGQWWVLQSSGGAIGQQWGMAGDKAMPNSYLPQ